MGIVGICKITIVVLGVVVVGLGCFSHFQSTWAKSECAEINGEKVCRSLYQLCDILKILQITDSCPAIEMERYFISFIIICLTLSAANLVASSRMETRFQKFKQLDIGYHVLSGVLLLIVAMGYIMSAEKIKLLLEDVEAFFGADIGIEGSRFNFRRTTKLAAGALTILESILYGITAIIIAKDKSG